MKITELEPEVAKALASIIQQRVMLTSSHQKASAALANFELAVGHADRNVDMSIEKEAKTRAGLKASVKLSAKGLKVIDQLEVV